MVRNRDRLFENDCSFATGCVWRVRLEVKDKVPFTFYVCRRTSPLHSEGCRYATSNVVPTNQDPICHHDGFMFCDWVRTIRKTMGKRTRVSTTIRSAVKPKRGIGFFLYAPNLMHNGTIADM